MSAEIFEAKPRWPGAPPICLKTNLPAFETPKDYGKFEGNNCPGNKVLLKWKCSACGCLHFYGIGAGDPSGGSSGTGRASKRSHDLEYIASIFKKFGLKQKQAEAMQ